MHLGWKVLYTRCCGAVFWGWQAYLFWALNECWVLVTRLQMEANRVGRVTQQEIKEETNQMVPMIFSLMCANRKIQITKNEIH